MTSMPFMSLVESCLKYSDRNQTIINGIFRENLSDIKNILDLQYNVHINYCWTVNLENMLRLEYEHSLLITAFTKNLFSLYSAILLTESGFYGSARIILRNAFEFLLISKFASITDEKEVVDLWHNGENITLSRSIFKKFDVKNKDKLSAFWGDLCKYCHAMIYSQQVSLDAAKEEREIELTLVYIRILLECNYHLLVGHVVNSSMKYYAKTYGNLDLVPKFKKELNKIFQKTRKDLEKHPKKIIRAYKAKWETAI